MTRAAKLVLAGAAFAGALSLSPVPSGTGAIALSIGDAQARVGRPLTPVSVAGVARRQNRRGYGYGLAGAAAVGTAGAIAANSYYGSAPVEQDPGYYGGGPGYGVAGYGYRGGGPYRNAGYYGRAGYGGVGANSLAYYGGPANDAGRGYSYHGEGYVAPNVWSPLYTSRNGMKCEPGTAVQLEDGHTYPCQ